MNNSDNLIPMSQRSENEARELGRKGGVASGKSRRERKTIREGFNAILAAPVKDKDVLKELKAAGAQTNAQGLLLLRIYQKAINGDMQAAKLLLTAIGEADPAAIEHARAKEDIAYLRLEKEIAIHEPPESTSNLIEAMMSTADEVWGGSNDDE